MKKLLLLFAALLVAGCGEKSSSEGSESASEKATASNESAEPSADSPKPLISDADVERLLKEAVDMESLEERDDLIYHDNKPFSGWMKEMYDSGQVKGLGQAKDGVGDGPATGWHENGQKLAEIIMKDGEWVSEKYWSSKGEEVETLEDAQVSDSTAENPTPPSEDAKPSADTAKPPVAESPSEESRDNPSSLSDADVERLLKEAVDVDSLEARDGLLYQPNESEPFSGWSKMMYDSGQVQELSQFKDGVEDGPYTSLHENGQKKSEGTYKNGVDDGLKTSWYKNGEKREVTYKDGVRDGLERSWHENGKKWSEDTYKEGKREGLGTVWYKDGQKHYEVEYKEGEQDGPHTSWYENGQKQSEGTYKNGVDDGPLTEWHENGQKSSERTFKNGEEVSGKYWNSRGEEVETYLEAFE